ncbi:MAG: winged helix DNA-binding protein [Eubacterium sp.]|jgi:Transcriptional regulators|nr:winged helix DNA-binding protein [Eubacterium sp.]
MNASKCLSEFNRIMKENDKIYRNAAKAVGLSYCSFWILYALRNTQELLTQSEICYETYLPKQTVNSALKKLEHENYIELLNINDRKSKQIRLTEKGAALAEKTVDTIVLSEQRSFYGLSTEEQETFLHLFQKYTDLLHVNTQTLTDSSLEDNSLLSVTERSKNDHTII